MKIRKDITEAAKLLGIKKLKKGQVDPINRILDKKNTMVIYPVGYGKSAIMQIPGIVNKDKPTLVFEPTISLMYDQVQHLKKLGIHAEYLSMRNKNHHEKILTKYVMGEVDFLYVAPERFSDERFVMALIYRMPWLVVVDEAHCVIEWGRSFREDYLKIGENISSYHQMLVILAMTATAPPEYRKGIQSVLNMSDTMIYKAPLNKPNLIVIVENMMSEKTSSRCKRVWSYINQYGSRGRIVVYCATKADTDKLFNFLRDIYPGEIAKCHSFMDVDKREKNEVEFIEGKKRIMIATTAFGMGVDVPDIRLVVHFSMPINPIAYYQQIGRAGRDGETSHCVMLYHKNDSMKFSPLLNNEYEEHGEEAMQEMKRGIDQMNQIAAGDDCIMQAVLKCLGEKSPKQCGRCTVCQRNRR